MQEYAPANLPPLLLVVLGAGFLATFTDNPFLYFLPCLSGSSKLRVL